MKSNLNSDYGYYNFVINNSSNDYRDADFLETRISPVLTNMQDWQLAVVRFKIPSVSIPLFIFEENEDGESPYYLGLSVGSTYANLKVKRVDFQPEYSNNQETEKPYSRFIYYYNSFLQMVNDTFTELYTEAQGEAPFNAILAPYADDGLPYFDLDNTTSYMRIYLPFNENVLKPCPFVKQEDGQVDYINIHLSNKLFYFMSGFNSKLLRDPQYLNAENVLNISIPNMFDNVVELPKWGTLPSLPARKNVVFYQDYSCLYLWNTLTRILLTTNIPVEQEFIGVKGQDGQNYQQILLTDFEVPPNREGNQRDYIYFFADFPRYQNFTSNGDLRTMDLRVYYQTRDLQTFLLKIPPTFELTVKLQFKRRKAVELLQYSASDKYSNKQGRINSVGVYV